MPSRTAAAPVESDLYPAVKAFLEAQGYDISNRRCVYVERIRPGDRVQSMGLEIIISRPLQFEFMIDPKQIQPMKGIQE